MQQPQNGELADAIRREVRAEMARQSVSQSALARRLGWRPDYVNRRLSSTGSRSARLSIGELEAIAAALGRPVSAFMPKGS